MKSIHKRTFLLLPMSIVLISLVILLVLRIPGIPYNARELFAGNNIFYYACFSMVLLWMGISGIWISRMMEITSRKFFVFPVFVVIASVISFILLYITVTTESMHDILGSPVIYRDVVGKNAWGNIGASFFQVVSAPLINYIELLVRYIAFYSPLVFFLVISNIAATMYLRFDFRAMAETLGLYFLYALPWVYVCKLIVIDFSATDNLSELVELSVILGVGGSFFIYLMLLIVTMGSVCLSRIGVVTRRTRIGILLFVLASVPAAWVLLNIGLADIIVKYGTTFSGVDFLLGPDRKHKLGMSELFLRWTFVQSALLVILAYGQWLFVNKRYE